MLIKEPDNIEDVKDRLDCRLMMHLLEKYMRDYVVMRRDEDVSRLANMMFIERIEKLYDQYFNRE